MAKKSAKKASKKSAKRPAKKAKKAAKKSAAKALKKAKKAAEKAAQKKRAALNRPLGDYVQAHLGRPSKFADGKTRNWTAFYFFRILSQANVEANAAALGKLKALLGSLRSTKVDGIVHRQRDLVCDQRTESNLFRRIRVAVHARDYEAP